MNGAVDLVITDVDGTLVVPNTNMPTKGVHKAVAEVHKAGITLAAATGRPYEMTKKLFMDIGLTDECIFDNGATIRNVSTGKIIWKNWLDVERVKQAVAILKPHATMIDCFPDWRETDAKDISLSDIVEPAPYAFAFINFEASERVSRLLSKIPNINYHVVQHYDLPELAFAQITDIHSDKFHAVQHLRRLVHSHKKQVLAIGDQSNDLALFKGADIKVAMGNAIDELKELADYVVASVEQDGFAEAMRKFVLN